MLDNEKRFIRICITVEAIAICNLILNMFSEISFARTSGLAVYCVALLIDILIVSLLTPKKFERTVIVLRYCVILLVSVYIVFFYNRNLLAITVMLLLCQIFDLVFRVDFTDMYTRLIIMSISAFPIALLAIVEQLFFAKIGNSYAIDMISVVGTLIVTVSYGSKIFTDWIHMFERKLLEQRRKNENAIEANESLMLYQDKLRRVNEELGIQKIRVESANRQVSKSNAEMKVQNEVLKYVSSTINQEELMEKAAQSLKESMSLKFCSVVMRDVASESKILYQECQGDISDEFMEYLKECITKERVKEITALNKIHVEKSMHYLYTNVLKQQDELAAIITVPVISEHGVEGVIVCGHERQDYFDESKTVFENIAAQLLMALKNAKLYAKVQQLAIRDGLTGLYNRRELNRMVSEFGQAATENATALSAVLMDIDNFKGFNDTYGHAFGDQVLVELAKLIETCAEQNSGISARYGGEEFVLVFPEKSMSEVYEIVKVLQETVNNTSLDYSGESVSIHISIGISSFPETAERPETILNRADAAMYYAKRNGKNQITKDSDEILAYFRKKSKEAE